MAAHRNMTGDRTMVSIFGGSENRDYQKLIQLF